MFSKHDFKPHFYLENKEQEVGCLHLNLKLSSHLQFCHQPNKKLRKKKDIGKMHVYQLYGFPHKGELRTNI